MIETLILSITSFIGTNIDDLFIDMLFFAEAKTKAERNGIMLGKYLGIGILTFISILGAFGLQLLPQEYIGYLGLVPICLGIREILRQITRQEEDDGEQSPRSANMVMNVALITIASGADNLGVYIPLFAGFAAWQMVLTVCMFLICIAVWCFLGKTLTDLPVLRDFLMKYKSVMVPAVYIALGGYLLLG